MPSTPPTTTKSVRSDRLKRLVEEYGRTGIMVYIVLCLLNFVGVYLAIQFGWRPESAVGQAGTFGAAYVVYKVTMPVRIGGAVLLTPLVAKLASRFVRPRTPQA